MRVGMPAARATAAYSEWKSVQFPVPSVRQYSDGDVVGCSPEGVLHAYVSAVHPTPVLVRREVVSRFGWSTEPTRAKWIQRDLLRRGMRIYAADIPNE